jgi:hypothetical protein
MIGRPAWYSDRLEDGSVSQFFEFPLLVIFGCSCDPFINIQPLVLLAIYLPCTRVSSTTSLYAKTQVVTIYTPVHHCFISHRLYNSCLLPDSMFHKLFTTALLALFVLGQVAESATLQDRAACACPSFYAAFMNRR